MNKGVVIADSGSIFSLAIISHLNLLDKLFDEVYISQGVWQEITLFQNETFQVQIKEYFEYNVKSIYNANNMRDTLGLGESESIILYQEINANFLLLDDKKARQIATELNINCIGTLSLLIKAKQVNILNYLRPVFIDLLKNGRYYSVNLLNNILMEHNEQKI